VSKPTVRPGGSTLRCTRPGIAYCRQPARSCRPAGLRAQVRVRWPPGAAGHSYAGWSSTRGLIIDVTRMYGVKRQPAAPPWSARGQPGSSDFYNGLAAPRPTGCQGGSWPTVGIAAAHLGGGVVLHRGSRTGLRGGHRDNVVAEIVTGPKGQRSATCNSSQNSDLVLGLARRPGANFRRRHLLHLQLPIRPGNMYVISCPWPWSQPANGDLSMERHGTQLAPRRYLVRTCTWRRRKDGSVPYISAAAPFLLLLKRTGRSVCTVLQNAYDAQLSSLLRGKRRGRDHAEWNEHRIPLIGWLRGISNADKENAALIGRLSRRDLREKF